MAYSTLGSVATAELIATAWGNNVNTNFEDHESRITQNETAITSIGILKGYIAGLEISNGTDTDHDIDIATGIAAADDESTYLTLSSGLTKQIDAAWAKGTNQGGLDTGSVANDTFYYFWVIEQDSTSDIDILISASQTSPTMPSGWTAKRRIRGAVLTDGSANILAFSQKDNYFKYNPKIQDISNTAPGTSKNLGTVSVPPNFLGDFVLITQQGVSANTWIQETSFTDNSPAIGNSDTVNSSSADRGDNTAFVTVDGSSQIAYRTNNATIDIYINTRGFYDNAQ